MLGDGPWTAGGLRLFGRTGRIQGSMSAPAFTLATARTPLQFAGPMTDDTRALAIGLQKQDPDLLDRLIEQHQHRLFRYLVFLTGNTALAEDLFQETWIRVLERGAQYNGKSKFESWLFAIARHLVIDASRRKKVASLEELGDTVGKFVQVVFPLMSSRDFLAYLAAEIGAPPADSPERSVEESLRRLEFTLGEEAHNGRHAVIVVEEAHLLEDSGLLETLRLLLNLQAAGAPMFTLLLVGQPSLLTAMQRRLGSDFEAAVQLVLECKGRVVVAGAGKSGQISRKIAATLSSTGTPAFYLHPSDALHGDLGMIGRADVLLLVSNSGESQEIIGMLPTIQVFNLPIIAILGRPDSTLGRAANIVLDAAVEREACPMDLAPTTSTTAALAMGDALAMALLDLRDFKPEDFALYHPGGALGKKLLTTIKSLMHTGDSLPLIKADAIMQDAVLEISEKALGVTGVVDDAGHLVGAITDGDLRRGLSRNGNLMSLPVTDFMTVGPKRIGESEMAVAALAAMEDYSITALFVMSGEDERIPIGLIHIHDILRIGIRR